MFELLGSQKIEKNVGPLLYPDPKPFEQRIACFTD